MILQEGFNFNQYMLWRELFSVVKRKLTFNTAASDRYDDYAPGAYIHVLETASMPSMSLRCHTDRSQLY
jgi:hypothetical protein